MLCKFVTNACKMFTSLMMYNYSADMANDQDDFIVDVVKVKLHQGIDGWCNPDVVAGASILGAIPVLCYS